MDLRLTTLKSVSFYLPHNVPTLNQCRKLSCSTVVCKQFASYHDCPNYIWDLIRYAKGYEWRKGQWWQAQQLSTGHGSDFWDSEQIVLVGSWSNVPQFGATCADIKEIKRMNSKGSAKQEDKSVFLLHDNARPHTGLRIKEAISTSGRLFLIIPTVQIYHPLRTPFCGRDETRRAWRTPTPHQSVLRERHRASHAKVESVLIVTEILCKSNLTFLNDVPMTYENFNIIVSIVSENN
jgi:hypothetical protein